MSESSKSDNRANDRRIDYLEFTVRDVVEAKTFYGAVFDWKFEDYGPDYASFHDGRLAGGFIAEGSADALSAGAGGTLVVCYATDLAAAQTRVESAGGRIVKPTFDFPGGRRFHFTDPSGNALAVWSE